jgi:hypothetical protein
MSDPNTWRGYRRINNALYIAAALTIIGWVALWFRSPWRVVAFVVWGVAGASAVILAIMRALWRCPRCRQRGFGMSLWTAERCPDCDLPKFAEE